MVFIPTTLRGTDIVIQGLFAMTMPMGACTEVSSVVRSVFCVSAGLLLGAAVLALDGEPALWQSLLRQLGYAAGSGMLAAAGPWPVSPGSGPYTAPTKESAPTDM